MLTDVRFLLYLPREFMLRVDAAYARAIFLYYFRAPTCYFYFHFH